MKFYLRLLVAGVSLFILGSVALVHSMTVEDFNDKWDNGPISACYSGNKVVACSCTGEDALRGCVRDSKQSTGSFSNPGDVEIRKLVLPTAVPGVFDVNVLLRGKRVPQIRDDLNVCSVVVFDVSGSMGKKSGSQYLPDENRYSAVSGAIEFSQVVISGNPNARVGLVTFGYTGQVKKELGRDVFDNSLFYLDPKGVSTNVHAGLIEARKLFVDAGCVAKYVVLMSDGVPTHYMSGDEYFIGGTSSNNYKTARDITIPYAQELKDEGVQIYTIGYNVASSSVAAQTLRAIASDASHYFLASGANISDIFHDIGNVTVEINAGTPSNIEDNIGGAMLNIGDIQLASGAEIIDPGTVYSFQIKIRTGVVGFFPSNDGLTLLYDDVSGNAQTLAIDSDHTAKIYWNAPKCEGLYPSGTSIKTGADTFAQDWVGDVLKPENKEWSYTSNSTPGECEWTCNDENYGGNTNTNTCEIKVRVDFDVNGGTGNVPSQIVISGMNASEPVVQPTRTGYQFSGWALSGEDFILPGTVTGNITLEAIRNPNKYIVNFDGNGSTSGTMGNQVFTYDVTGALDNSKFEREGYHFSGWNTKVDGSGIEFKNEEEVKNLVISGEFNLYAQWEPNPYIIIFDGNGASAGTMSGMDMIYDQEKALTMNSYSRNGYEYIGWNTQENGGGVSYTNGQVVKNLANEGEVRLYAQWKKLGSSGGGGGGGGCKKDDCPDGDYSGDRCDGKCGTPPKPEPEEKEPKPNPKPTPTPTPNPVIPSKKCSIEGSTHSREVNEAYIWACERGIIDSNTIQGAKLGEFLNRAEMAKITTLFELGEVGTKPNKNKNCSAFADSMSGYNQKMKDYMTTSCQLERMGIHTSDHKPILDFMPRKFVSRAEFGTILSRILWGGRYEASKNSRYYYVEHLNRLKEAGILSNIDPTLVERRSYAILMIYRAAKIMGKI